MNEVIKKLNDGFESSSITTPEFRKFFSTFKKEFRKELNTINATNILFSRGHFYISGFFTIGTQVYYFSIPDVRGYCSYHDKLLYRTARHYKDYLGGMNRYVCIESGMCKKMLLISEPF